MAEKYIALTNDYARQRIPQTTFDPSAGEDPFKVRYSTTVPEDAEYADLLINGDESSSMDVPDCNEDLVAMNANINKRGAFGCNIPGSTIYNGYDKFFRTLKGRAWDTDPICVMDLILKKHTAAYIRMLRTDLPKRAMEQFNRSLVRNVIDGGKYNSSIVSGFTYAQGVFPARPEGVLDIGYLKRLRTLLAAEGWNDMPFEIQVSREGLSAAVQNWKQDHGLDINTTPVANDKIGLEGVDVVEYEGIRFVLTDRPTRGYLVPQIGGGYKFHVINPTIHRAGTGGGIVPEVDPDYFNCFHYCNGQKHELYELHPFIHPRAATREAFAAPQMADKRFSKNLFNFEVNMIDGAYIENNVDNFKFYMRLLHAYAFESLNPELMGGVLSRVSPDQINIHAPSCASEVDVYSEPIEIEKPAGPRADSGTQDECAPCDDPEDPFLDPLPTEDATCPANDTGVVRFYNCGPIATTKDSGNLLIAVERVDGTVGAASVDVTVNAGTATDGVDYTDPGSPVTLDWAALENGRKYITIPILPGGAGGLNFSVSLDNAVGAALADGSTTGCTTLQVDID